MIYEHENQEGDKRLADVRPHGALRLLRNVIFMY